MQITVVIEPRYQSLVVPLSNLFVRGWYSVVVASYLHIEAQSSAENMDTNCGPVSVKNVFGIPDGMT